MKTILTFFFQRSQRWRFKYMRFNSISEDKRKDLRKMGGHYRNYFLWWSFLVLLFWVTSIVPCWFWRKRHSASRKGSKKPCILYFPCLTIRLLVSWEHLGTSFLRCSDAASRVLPIMFLVNAVSIRLHRWFMAVLWDLFTPAFPTGTGCDLFYYKMLWWCCQSTAVSTVLTEGTSIEEASTAGGLGCFSGSFKGFWSALEKKKVNFISEQSSCASNCFFLLLLLSEKYLSVISSEVIETPVELFRHSE